MEVKFWLVSLFFIFVGLWTCCNGRRSVYIFCDPKDHRYYRADLKMCRTCDPCHIGEGIISYEEVNMGPNGATTCPDCCICLPGTFSASREYECQNCRNCSAQGRETFGCTPKENAVCGNLFITTLPQPTNKTTAAKTKSPSKVESTLDKIFHKQVWSYLWVLIILPIAGFIWLCFTCRRGRGNLQRTVEEDSQLNLLPTKALNDSSMPRQHDDSSKGNADCSLIACENDTKQSTEEITKSISGSTTSLASVPQDSKHALAKDIAGGIGPKRFAELFGIDKQNMNIILKENHRSLFECSYQMLEKLCQIKPHLKVEDLQHLVKQYMVICQCP